MTPINNIDTQRKLKPKEQAIVVKAVSLGLSKTLAADIIGISPETLYAFESKNPSFSKKIKQATGSRILKYTNLLVDKIEKGNLSALLFWLKTKAGFNEKAILEHTGEVNHIHLGDLKTMTDVEFQMDYLVENNPIKNNPIKGKVAES